MSIIAKYFWDQNATALRQTLSILRNPRHPKFAQRMVALLSRCDRPQTLFKLISKEDFIASWPKINAYWSRVSRDSDFKDWWETIFEQLLVKQGFALKKPGPDGTRLSQRVGELIKKTRLEKGLSQKQLSLLTGVKQPEISKIEEGKKNITLKTMSALFRKLDIKKIELGG